MTIANKEQIADYYEATLERVQAMRRHGPAREVELAVQETARHFGQDAETVRRVLAERAEEVA